jgi:hypothetical protein
MMQKFSIILPPFLAVSEFKGGVAFKPREFSFYRSFTYDSF